MPERTRPRLSRRQVFADERTPLDVSRYVLDGTHAAHSHDFVEVALVCGGEGVHREAHGARIVSRGDAFLLRPGSWHAYQGCRRLEVYNCCFGTELLRRELAWLLEDPLVGQLFGTGPFLRDSRGVVPLSLDEQSLDTCRRHLDALHGLAPDALECRADLIGHLLLFLGELARTLRPQLLVVGPTPAHPAVLAAISLLEASAAHQWTLDELADGVSLDPSYLVRLFKSGVGMPPMAYLNRHRAERAAYLLLRTDRSVSRIGAEVGWADPSYFARRFKACFGISASAYRSGLLPGGMAQRPDRSAS